MVSSQHHRSQVSNPLSGIGIALVALILLSHAGSARENPAGEKAEAPRRDNGKVARDFQEILKSADLVADVELPCKIDVGFGSTSDSARSPIYFQPEELAQFLRSEKHKQLLVVRLGTSIVKNGQNLVNETILKLQPFLQSLGYRRVVVIGMRNDTFEIIEDYSENLPANPLGAEKVADRVLRCENRIDKIDLGLPILLRRDEISTFLKNDKHKDCLQIEVGKAIGEESERQLLQFFNQLGYKKIDVRRNFGIFQVEPVVLQ